MKPIAIGGSAANPPHLVHALLISKLLECNRFSKVIWIISGDRKDKQYNVTPDDRVTMTELTIGQLRGRFNTELIIKYNDVYYENTPTITYIENIKKEFPQSEVIWYTGSDSIIPKYDGKCEIEAKWHRGEELMKTTSFLVFPRKRFKLPDTLPSNIEIFNIELPNISSSDIRKKIKKRQVFEHLVTPLVAIYIIIHKLYGYGEKL